MQGKSTGGWEVRRRGAGPCSWGVLFAAKGDCRKEGPAKDE